MKNLLLLILSIVVVSSVSCRKHDVRTMWISVPEMKNQACADYIKNAVNKVKGVERDLTEINLEDKTVLVTYQSTLMSMKNIEFYIADAGFSANEVPANKKARAALPAECK
jgi:copper chaperone CopZ